MFSVAKAFRTPTRRFAVGATVSADDVAGPAPIDRLVALGHLVPLPPPNHALVEPALPLVDDAYLGDVVGADADQPTA